MRIVIPCRYFCLKLHNNRKIIKTLWYSIIVIITIVKGVRILKKILAFLQKIGKSLMFPIATLPAAALLVRFGAEDMLNWPIMAAGGDAILGNLPIIFAIGIAMGFAVDGSGGAAMAGAIAQLVLVAVFKAVNTAAGFEGTQELDMKVFGGIISGLVAGTLYNKFYQVKFPEWLSFFGGRRFVPIVTAVTMTILAYALTFVWAPIQGGIDSAGNWVLSAGTIGVGVYGFLNRLLIPVGLHHVINTVVWFDFGSYTTAAGEVVHGEINRFLKGDPTAGRFLSGFFPVMMFGLPAAALAMYVAAKKEKKALVGGMFVSIGLTAFVTGVTEPIEFLFMFLSPVLYVLHAILTAGSMMAADMLGILDGFGFSAGLIDYIINLGIATKPLLLIPLGLAVGVVYFVIFYAAIKIFDLKTPGREDDDDEEALQVTGTTDEVLDAKAFYTIEGLGGEDNIERVDYCTTRLRLTVKNAEQVNDGALKKVGSKGVMRISKTNVQVIIGTSVEFLAEAMKTRLANGNPSLQQQVAEADLQATADETIGQLPTNDFVMPVTGDLIPLSEVPDAVFSGGAMGPGFGIANAEGVITSPVDGKVTLVFPTKHAIGITTDTGVEILLHIGLDSVKLNGEGFTTFVKQGDLVQRGDKLVEVDWAYLQANAPSTVTPIIFTNLQGKEVTLLETGKQQQGKANIITLS